MGYRSDVMIAIKTPAITKDVRELLLVEWKSEHGTGEGVEYFFVEEIKWYESYPNIAFMQKFVEDNEEDSCLLRLGEDYGDLEIIGDTDAFGICVSRGIDVPAGIFDCSHFSV